jgi:hypothetical protein
MMLLNQTLRLLLDSIGRREEYEFYLKRFQDSSTPAFAVVCPDAASVEQATEMLMFDLEFLLRVDLVPLILLAGPEAQGMRDILAAYGSPCGFLRLDEADGADLADRIRALGEAGRIPIVVDARPPVEVLLQVLPGLSRRVLWVRPQGALRTLDGEPAWYLYTRKPNRLGLTAADEGPFARCRELVEQVDGLHVSVTSPLNLLRELFTVKGAGTMVRRGSIIRKLHRIRADDRTRLLALLEDSFQRPVRNRRCLDPIRHAYVEDGFRGAALLEEHPVGAYLSKFAVGTEARGEGLAQELWEVFSTHHPRLFWRSREHNPINHWYKSQADGRQRWGGWMVFWRGVPVESIPAIIAYCVERPPDLEDPAPTPSPDPVGPSAGT